MKEALRACPRTRCRWDSTVILHEAGVPPIHTPATELGPSTESRIAHVRAARSRRNGGYRQASAGCARENLLRPHSSEGLPLGHRPQDRIVRLSSPHCGNPRSSAPVSDACTAVAQRTRALVGTVGAAVDGRCGVENTIVIDVDLTVPRPNRHSTHVLPRLKNVHSCRQPRHLDLRSEPCFADRLWYSCRWCRTHRRLQ